MKADGNGFLLVDKPVSIEQLSHGISGVHADTGAILSILKSGARQAIQSRQRVRNTGASPASRTRPAGEAVNGPLAPSAPRSIPEKGDGKSLARVAAALERERDERGRFMAAPTAELTAVAKAIKSMTRKQAEQQALESRERDASKRNETVPGTDHDRDKRGRFVGAGHAGGMGGGSSNGGDKVGSGVFARLKNLFTGIKTPHISVGDFDKVDPTVEASKELGRIVGGPLSAVATVGKAVVGRGFGGAKNASITWFRRIFQELHLSRTQAGAFGLTETRVLKDIEHKTGGGAGAGSGGGKGLLGSLAGGAGDLLGGLGGLLGKGGGLLGGLLKGGLKRLPLLGALFAGGSALASAFGPGDPNKTDEENRKDKFTGVGSGVGALIGGGIGMLLGPVGAMVGGVIGDKVGEMVGEWLSTVDWSAVGKSMTDAWDGAVKWVQDSWKTVTDKLGDITKTVGDAWNSIISGAKAFIKDKFGIDIDANIAKAKAAIEPAVQATKDFVAPAVDKAKEIGGAVVDKGKQVGSAVVDYGKERVTKMAVPIGRVADKAADTGNSILEKVVPGYRHSASFDGIKGGDSLAKNGSYTDAEADKIRQLKSSGANTSANLKGGMPQDVQAKIIAAAQANGLDPKEMLKIASMESGGNGNAISSTGAVGIFQFTGKTASGVGVKDRFNVDQNIAGGMKLTQDNMKMLQAAGLPASAENLYMMHQLGPGAAKEIINGAKDGKNISDLSAGAQKAVSLNYGAGSKTAADYLAKNGTALTARADSVVGNSAAGYLPTVASGASPALPAPVVSAAASAPPPAPPMPTASAPPPTDAPPTVAANIPQQLNTPGPVDVRVTKDASVGQDLSDRRLAQIATGGIATG